MAQFAIDEILTTGIAISGFVFDVSNNIGANGYVLTSTSSGVMWQQDSSNTDLSALSGQIAATGSLLNNRINSLSGYANNTFLSGVGVSNYVPRWSGTKLLVTGSIFDLGTGVGIGTTDPVALLTVGSTTTTSSEITLQGQYQSSVFNNANIFNFRHGGFNRWRLLTTQNSAASNDFDFSINAINATVNAYNAFLTIKGLNGNVGISTTNPTTLLSVGGAGSTTAASGLTFGGDAQANLYRSAEDTIKTDGSLVVAANATFAGNVGIGLTNPAVKLDVSGGNARFSDYIIVGEDLAYPSNTGSAYLGYSTSPASSPQSNLELIDALSNAIGVNDPLRFRNVISGQYFSGSQWYEDPSPLSYRNLLNGNATSYLDLVTSSEYSVGISGKRFVVDQGTTYTRPNFILLNTDWNQNFWGFKLNVENSNDLVNWTNSITEQTFTTNNTRGAIALSVNSSIQSGGISRYFRFSFVANQAITAGSLRVNKIRSLGNQNYSSTIPVSTSPTGHLIASVGIISPTITSLSGNLTTTGSTLDTKINTLSGYSNSTFATISSLNTTNTNLAATGSTLNNKINSLSGYITTEAVENNRIYRKCGLANLPASPSGWYKIAQFEQLNSGFIYDLMHGEISYIYGENQRSGNALVNFNAFFRQVNNLASGEPFATYSYELRTSETFKSFEPFRIAKTVDLGIGPKTYELQVSPIGNTFGLISWDIKYTSTNANSRPTVYGTEQVAGNIIDDPRVSRFGNKIFTDEVGIGIFDPLSLLSVGGSGSTTALSGITFGGDSSANLYRISTARLQTDGSLTIGGQGGLATALTLNRSSTSNENGIAFNSLGSTDWYYYVDGGNTHLQIQRSSEIDSAPRVRFDGANSNVLFNLGGGNVGIGTASPSGRLHVSGNIFLSADLIGNDGTRGYLLGKDSVAGGRCYLILDPDAADGIGVGSDYLYIAQENTTGVIRNPAGTLLLNDNGNNVGLGTSLAIAQFHIGGTASNNNPWMVLDVNDTFFKRIIFSEERPTYGVTGYGGYLGYDAAANTISLGTYHETGEYRALNILRQNGYVGIGTTAPTNTLQVVGQIAIKGDQSADNAKIHIQASDNSNRYTIETDLDATTSNDLLIFRSYTADNMLVLKGNGNIGINTTNPADKIQISGGGISFTTSTGLAVPMLGLTAINVAYIGPYATSTDGNAPTLVAFNQGASVQQTYFYSSGKIAMVLNKEGRLNIAGNAGNTPPALLNVGPTSSVDAVSGMSFGNDSSANLYRSAASTIKTDGSLEVATNLNVAADLYVADELGVGVPIANKRFNYGAEIEVASASIQLVLGRLGNATGQGGIGADANNAFAVWNVSGQTKKQFVVSQQGNVGIQEQTPLAPLHVGLGGDWPSSTGSSAMVFIKQNTANAGLVIQEPGDSNFDRALHLYTNVSVGTIEATYRDTGPYPHLAFRTSGTERVRIASNGLVGISSNVPTDFLDFGGAGKNIVFGYAAYGEVLNSAASIIGNNVKASPTAFSQVRRFANATDQGNFIKLIFNKGVTFHTNITSALNTDISEDTNERMRINLSGDVGIGAINPIYRLQLQANNPTNGVLAQFYNYNAGALGANGAFTIWTQYGIADWFIGQPSGVNALTFGRDKTSSATGVEYMRINSAGNIGIGINNPSVKLAVNGEASFGDGSKLTLIGLDINSGATPSFIKIRTKIPFASAAADFTINIKGFRYNSAETTNLSICWHYYLSTFYNPSISSAGSFAPTVKLSAEDWDSSGTPKVCIVLVGPGYWPKLYVESMYSSAYNDEYADGWDWVDADATGTGNNLAILAYKSNFGNNFLMLNNGYVGIGSANPTQRLDVGGYVMAGEGLYRTSTYGTNGGAWISFGDTGVLDSLGRIGAYSALFNINSINGDTSFQYNGSEKMRITTAGKVGIGMYNPTTLLSVGGSGSTTAASGITFGSDPEVNLYRSAENVLKTDGSLIITDSLGVGLSPTQKLQVDGVVGNPALNGTTQSGIFRISNTTDNAVLDFGIRAGGLGAWIQSTDETSLDAYYPLLLNPNGARVGVGLTTNISGILHVRTPAAGDQTLLVLEHSAGYGNNTENRIDFFDDEPHKIASRIAQYYSTDSNNRWGLKFYTNPSAAINPTPALTLRGNNNVGVGTTSPIERLHVSGNIHVEAESNSVGGNGIYLGGVTNRYLAIRQTSTNKDFAFDTYNDTESWVNRLTILNNGGNVGINSTAPNTKLRVNGSFSQRASGITAIQEYKNIVTFSLDGNGNGGYVVKTPFRIGSTYEMVILHVKGYGYGVATLYDFKVVFYDYQPSHAPVNYSIIDLGNDGLPKYLAKDADNYIQVCFGSPTDVNNYFYRFTVDCITTRQGNDYSQGWGMYQTTGTNFGFASTGVYALNSPLNFRTNLGVGLGTTNPQNKLSVIGSVNIGSNNFNSTAPTNGLIVEGNVGIGISSTATYINSDATSFRPNPAGKFLDVYSSANEANINLITNNSGDGSGIGGIYFTRARGQADNHYQIAAIKAVQGGTNGLIAGGKLYFYTKSNGGATLATAPAMTIATDSNVGIGTTVPNSILELYKVPATSGTLQPMLTITSDYPSAITTNFGSSIVFKGRTAGNELQDNAQISAYNENINDNGYALGFYTRPTVAAGLLQRLTILRGGNVGVGTTSPSAKLQIDGTGANLLTVGTLTNDWGGVVAVGTPNGNGIILSKVNTTNDANRVLTIMRDDTNGASIFGYTPVGTSTSIGFQIRASGSSYFNGGNVGIGTASMSFPLTVQGIVQARGGVYVTQASPTNTLILNADSTSLHKIYTNSTVDLSLGTNSSNTQVYLKNGGNVGVGQNNPIEKLQVQGNIYATDGSLFNFKAQRIPIEGSPQGGTYKGYLILAKAYTSGFVEASYVIGKVILRRGTSGSGHNVDIYEVNSSRGYNTEIFQVSRLGAIDTRFVRLVKVTYGGVVYHAIETSDSGGQPSTEMYFEGSIVDSPLILTDATFVSNVTAFGNGVIFVDQNSNIGIGTTSPDVKLHVRGEQVYLYNDLNTNNTYFYARNSSAGNAGIKMKNSQGEWTIIANDRLRFIDDDAGVERLSILSNGNVGIGIVAPTDKIQISGGGISFTSSTGLAIPMLGVTATNVAYVGPYTTTAEGVSPSLVLFNQGASVQQTWFYSSGRVAMVLNKEGRLHIGNTNNTPNCLLSVGPTSATTAVSGMCFGNDAEANLYRSAEDTIKTDGNLIVVGNVTAANLVSGNGTANYITKWNGTKSIANSQIFDDGTYVGVNTAVNTTYRLQVNGSFAATTKSFDITHPTISGKRLIYASLEGPENGVYFRGRNNNNEINLPHYWSGLVHDDSITVDLTSVGKRKDGRIRNYSVDQIGHNKVYIYTDSDDNIYDYYYTIFAERKDVCRLITERDME